MDIKTILKQIAAIQKCGDLTPWEKDFATSIAERAEKFGDTLHVSDKQAAIIQKIFGERVEGIKSEKPAKKSESNPFPSDSLPA